MTLISILSDVLLFYLLVFGFGLAWLPVRWRDPAEALTWTAAAGLATVYLVAGALYLTKAPVGGWWLLPAAALAIAAIRRDRCRAWMADPAARKIVGRLLLVTGWCVAWLALIPSYSGGEWCGDWLEHYQRARFFTDHQPPGTQFIGEYGLTARPPLANLVVAAGLQLRGLSFAHAQLFLTLFSALCVLPMLAFARWFSRDDRGDALVVVLMMFSPFIVQNATFAWTKLPSAFFVLTALVLYLRGVRESDDRRIFAAAAAIACGVLTHYSAAPYAIAFAVLHACRLGRGQPVRAGVIRYLGLAVVFTAVLSTWVGWAWLQFGAATTFLTNTSVTEDAGMGFAARVSLRLQTLWVTLVPHPLRATDYQFIAQTSREGWWRDYFFNIYQTTLLGAVGLSGLVRWLGSRAKAPLTDRAWPPRFWLWFGSIVALLSFASVAHADRWGVVHLGLQPLALAALVYLAVGRSSRGRWQTCAWGAALAIDAALGIMLQFHVTATQVLTAEDVNRFMHGQVFTLSHAAARNLLAKSLSGVSFLWDGGPHPLLVVLLIAMFAFLALRSVWLATRSTLHPPHHAA